MQPWPTDAPFSRQEKGRLGTVALRTHPCGLSTPPCGRGAVSLPLESLFIPSCARASRARVCFVYRVSYFILLRATRFSLCFVTHAILRPRVLSVIILLRRFGEVLPWPYFVTHPRLCFMFCYWQASCPLWDTCDNVARGVSS